MVNTDVTTTTRHQGNATPLPTEAVEETTTISFQWKRASRNVHLLVYKEIIARIQRMKVTARLRRLGGTTVQGKGGVYRFIIVDVMVTRITSTAKRLAKSNVLSKLLKILATCLPILANAVTTLKGGTTTRNCADAVNSTTEAAEATEITS